jgi:hypothetical protein
MGPGVRINMLTKGYALKGLKGMRIILPAAAILVLLIFSAFNSASALQQREDPVEVIKKRSTAGMKLQDGKAILVRNGKVYVRSGRSLRPLLPEKAQIIVTSNKSGIASNGIVKLAEEAIKSKWGALYNKSYKIHSSFELKDRSETERTVICNLTFEHKNIWYAEERKLEILIGRKGQAYTLKDIRDHPPDVVVDRWSEKETAKLKVVARPAIKPVPARRLATRKAPSNLKFKTSVNRNVTAKVAAKYPTFGAVPIHDLVRDLGIKAVPAGPTAKGLANTAYPEVETAKEATGQVYTLFLVALGSASRLVGPAESSKNNVLNYLRNDNNLIAWNNIGHGNKGTLFQNGTNIYAGDISGGAASFNGLNNCVCLINSCQTFNDPLKAAILGRGPRTYIAGVINLPMVTSEGSNPNFWFKVLFQNKAMSVAYNETNNEAGLNGYWGFWGDSGIF